MNQIKHLLNSISHNQTENRNENLMDFRNEIFKAFPILLDAELKRIDERLNQDNHFAKNLV